LFRIDRNLVNVSAARTAQVDKEGIKADASGERPDAAAFMAEIAQTQAMAKARDILSEAEIKAKEEADKIIEAARSEAANIIMSARDEVEELNNSARQEGFEKGAEEGRHSYDEQLKATIDEDNEKLKNVISELYDERKRAFEGLEEEVVDLAMEIVRKVVNPDEGGTGVFEALVRNALRQINPDGKIVIRVSQDEYERFFSYGSALFELDRGVKVTASILRDVSLSNGDCIIDTEDATINAGFGTQMKYIELALNRANEGGGSSWG